MCHSLWTSFLSRSAFEGYLDWLNLSTLTHMSISYPPPRHTHDRTEMRQMEKIFFMILYQGKNYTIIRFFRKCFDGSSHEFTFLHPSLHLHCFCPSIIPAVTSSSLTLQSSLYLAARVMFFSNSIIGVTSLRKIFQ